MARSFARAVVGKVCPQGLLTVALVWCSSAVPVRAQAIDDGILLPQGTLFAGVAYAHESWRDYWEGTLERENGNIGTVTTQVTAIVAHYGVTDRLNVIGSVPYVRTRASQGVLAGMQGMQDLSLGAKFRIFDAPAGPLGTFRMIAAASAALPVSDYTPDFLPLSIGTRSRRASTRATINTRARGGLYLNGSAAYTWRGDVTLDRPYYYTDGRLFFTDTVDMPNVFDYVVTGGYVRGRWMATASFSQQQTLGGGDIRRQDMPFVSNRMNASRIGAMVMAPLPKLPGLSVQAAAAYTVRGRNVGRATTLTAGLLYALPFQHRSTP